MQKIIKTILKKIFRIFKIEVSLYKNSKHIIDMDYFLPFKEKDAYFQLYNAGIDKSKNQKSDNIYKRLRFFSLTQLVDYVIQKKIKGDFAECGCWKGHSSFIISHILDKNNQNKSFHIFDSFEGLSDFKDQDENANFEGKKNQISIKKHFESSENFVKNDVLNNFEFVKTYKGWIPSRFKEVEKLSFSLVHIDVDLYEPTYKSLEFFFPKLSKGGVIICDDYNVTSYPGSKKAWDNYFLDKNFDFFYQTPMGSCFIVK